MKTKDLTEGLEVVFSKEKGGPEAHAYGALPVIVVGTWPDVRFGHVEIERVQGGGYAYKGRQISRTSISKGVLVYGRGSFDGPSERSAYIVQAYQLYDIRHADLETLKAVQRVEGEARRERQAAERARQIRNLEHLNQALAEKLGEPGPHVSQAYARSGQVAIREQDLANLLGVFLEAEAE